jgi:hypothetical protein
MKKRPAPLASRPRSRRERRARAEPAIVRHFVMPGLEVGSATAKPRETVAAFLRRTRWAARDRQYGWQFRKGLPTILEINGEAVLRKQWTRRRIAANDNVRFVSYPRVLGARKLPVWNGAVFVTQATRNPGWTFLDGVVNAQYGSTLPISKGDFNSVVAFAAGCDARRDSFDYIFSTAVAVPDALDKILQPARAKHFWLGDTVSIVRDECRDVPTMLLTDREIVRDSTHGGARRSPSLVPSPSVASPEYA